MTITTKAGIGTFALAMLITGAIDSIRNLPATALFGTSLIFFFIFSAIVFLIPAALVSAELSSYSDEKSGIFHWVHSAFGKRMAFLAIWLQWISAMVWFPTILSFIAGTATYFVNPELASNKFYLVSIILITFWGLTFINLKGIHLSAKFSSVCAILGMIIPMVLIISLGALWAYFGEPIHVNFGFSDFLPNLSQSENWISLTAIMTAFLGMELATVHIKEVQNPQNTFPRALLFSVFIILITMTLGSLSIAMVLPKEKIHLVNGVMQAFSNFFTSYHISWLVPLIALMILIGSIGGIISWIISPAKGLLHAAKEGYLPAFFQKENKYGVAQNLLILQACVVSVICCAFLFMPSVNGSYWLLTALSTELYMLMYVLMFLAGIVLKFKTKQLPHHFTIPGKYLGMVLVGCLGLFGCLITLIVGFIPPQGIEVGSHLQYETMFCGGLVVMILPIIFFYLYEEGKSRALTKSLLAEEI